MKGRGGGLGSIYGASKCVLFDADQWFVDTILFMSHYHLYGRRDGESGVQRRCGGGVGKTK